MQKATTLSSTLTCPACGYSKTETMPTNACVYIYECTHCKELLKPLRGHCCVFCSYGNIPCPPVQTTGSAPGCCG